MIKGQETAEMHENLERLRNQAKEIPLDSQSEEEDSEHSGSENDASRKSADPNPVVRPNPPAPTKAPPVQVKVNAPSPPKPNPARARMGGRPQPAVLKKPAHLSVFKTAAVPVSTASKIEKKKEEEKPEEIFQVEPSLNHSGGEVLEVMGGGDGQMGFLANPKDPNANELSFGNPSPAFEGENELRNDSASNERKDQNTGEQQGTVGFTGNDEEGSGEEVGCFGFSVSEPIQEKEEDAPLRSTESEKESNQIEPELNEDTANISKQQALDSDHLETPLVDSASASVEKEKATRTGPVNQNTKSETASLKGDAKIALAFPSRNEEITSDDELELIEEEIRQLADLKVHVSSLERERVQALSEKDQALAELGKLKREMRKQQNELVSIKAEMIDQKGLESENVFLKQENEELRSELETERKRLESIQLFSLEYNQSLENFKKGLLKRVEALENEKKESQRNFETATQKIKEHFEQNEKNLEGKLQEQIRQNQILAKQIERLKDEREKENKTQETLNGLVGQLKESNESRKARKEKETSILNETAEKIKEMMENIEKLASQVGNDEHSGQRDNHEEFLKRIESGKRMAEELRETKERVEEKTKTKGLEIKTKKLEVSKKLMEVKRELEKEQNSKEEDSEIPRDTEEAKEERPKEEEEECSTPTFSNKGENNKNSEEATLNGPSLVPATSRAQNQQFSDSQIPETISREDEPVSNVEIEQRREESQVKREEMEESGKEMHIKQEESLNLNAGVELSAPMSIHQKNFWDDLEIEEPKGEDEATNQPPSKSEELNPVEKAQEPNDSQIKENSQEIRNNEKSIEKEQNSVSSGLLAGFQSNKAECGDNTLSDCFDTSKGSFQNHEDSFKEQPLSPNFADKSSERISPYRKHLIDSSFIRDESSSR